MEEEGTLRGGEKEVHEKRQGRDLNFMISVVILQGTGFVSVSSAWRGSE